MASLKYSRQREAIKDYLSSVTTHPTADTYICISKKNFQISVSEPFTAI